MSGGTAPAPAGLRPRLVLTVAILGSSMAFIDSTVVNVALPRIQTELGASLVTVQWVVEAYGLFLSALLLLGGALGDLLGRRRIFALGVAVFGLASVGCGLAPGIRTLVAARAVQGVGGALLTPGSLALIGALFPKDERGRAIGIWSGASGVASAMGPLLGGWFVDALSWRWVFFINVPIAAATMLLLTAGVPETRAPGARAIDWPGAALGTLGLGGLVYGLVQSPQRGFTAPIVLGALVTGAVALALFVLREARAPAPMVPLGLFRSRPFTAANLLTLLLYAALAVVLFFLPFLLIQVHGYTARAAGAALLPFVAIVFVLSPWTGGLVERHGPRMPLIVGPAVAALGLAALALPGAGGPYVRTFLPGVSVLGLGMAITIAPLTTTVMTAVDEERVGVASGINNAVARVAALLAIAALSLPLASTFSARVDQALAALAAPGPLRVFVHEQRLALAAITLPADTPERWRALIHAAIARAYVDAFRIVTLIAAALALAGALVAALLLPRRRDAGL
jgi:EmrB/QacA subfamily drug resistance transporter